MQTVEKQTAQASPRKIGRYEVDKLVGEGAMARVYRAQIGRASCRERV